MKKLVIVLLLLLNGCIFDMFNTKPSESIPQLVTQESVEYITPSIDISPTLLEECQPLKILGTTASFEDVLADRADTVSKYSECKKKHNDLRVLIIKALDIR